MRFAWQRLTFEFTALGELSFPPLLSANILRGALGVLSRKLACPATCPGATKCPEQATCLYARVFEPASPVALPSGLGSIPRPFVFRARHLDGLRVGPGEQFRFGMNLFTLDPLVPPHLHRTFASLEESGLGPARTRVRLLRMDSELCSVDLVPGDEKMPRVSVDFVTPTELKTHGALAAEPHFHALFARIRDRVATLQTLYGTAADAPDFRGLGERAELVRMTSCQLRTNSTTRHSTRTGQTHELAGFTGTADYEGDLTEFLPWLYAAQASGVGRHCVWGQGEIRVLAI